MRTERLEAAVVHGALVPRATDQLRITRFRGRVAAAPGIVQAIGTAIRPGQRVVISGPLPTGTEITIRVKLRGGPRLARFVLRQRLGHSLTASFIVRASDGKPVLRVGRELISSVALAKVRP